LNRLFRLALALVSLSPSLLALAGAAACGPDPKPGPPCVGPTYNLVVKAAGGPLPPDTRLNVRYGGNNEGETYALGEPPMPQAVHCDEDTTTGGAPGALGAGGGEAGLGGAGPQAAEDTEVWALRCRLYTQGPARIDVSASGYEPIDEEPLILDEKMRCQVPVEVELEVLMDAGT
jgi:hypothetical protein